MNNNKQLLPSALLLIALALCAGCTADNVRQGLYEGIRTRNDLQSSPAERVGKQESIDYREYERQRKEQGYSR
jgi:hypothetical protein